MRQLQRRRPLRPPDWPCAHRPSHTVPLSSSARRGTESSLSEGEDRRDGERQTTCRPAATQGPSKVRNERTQPKCLHALCCGANNKAAQSNQRCMESPCHDATLDNSSNRRTCCCCSGCQHTLLERSRLQRLEAALSGLSTRCDKDRSCQAGMRSFLCGSLR